MAVIGRRTWANIRDEVIKRCGNITSTGFSARVEYCVWSAHLYLCTTYHHFELDKVDASIVLSTSANSITLPSDCYIVLGLRLKDAPGTAILGEVTELDVRRVLAEYKAVSGQPKRRGRLGNKIYFDLKPAAAYTSELYYNAKPLAPDFSSTSPETDVDVDEHIIEMASNLVSGATSDGPYAGLNRDLLNSWLQAQPRSSTSDLILPDQRERVATQVPMGGAQG